MERSRVAADWAPGNICSFRQRHHFQGNIASDTWHAIYRRSRRSQDNPPVQRPGIRGISDWGEAGSGFLSLAGTWLRLKRSLRKLNPLFRRLPMGSIAKSLATGVAVAGSISLIAASAWAQKYRAGSIEVDHSWALATTDYDLTNSAAYMLLSDHGTEPDQLVSASSPIARKVVLHVFNVENGVLRDAPGLGDPDYPRYCTDGSGAGRRACHAGRTEAAAASRRELPTDSFLQ